MRFSPARSLSPLPNTYWVVPGRLLAGEYPGGGSEKDTRARLGLLQAAGISYFLDLTRPGELTPYDHLLQPTVKYLRAPIHDQKVPDHVTQMQHIQSRLRAAMTFGRSVYVHCRAGIGRTGTVVGCFLVEHGLEGEPALDRLNELWRQCARSKSWPMVPQTDEQAIYIQDWPAHRKSQRR